MTEKIYKELASLSINYQQKDYYKEFIQRPFINRKSMSSKVTQQQDAGIPVKVHVRRDFVMTLKKK